MIKKIITVLALIHCLVWSGNVLAIDLKIGYVDMRKIFFEYKKTKGFNKTLEQEEQVTKKEIEKKTQDIRKLRDELDLLSEDAREKRQPELRQKINALDEFRRGKVEEFIRKKDEMFKEIREDIMNVARKYATKNGYDLLFDEAVFVYAAEKYEITDKIMEELNK